MHETEAGDLLLGWQSERMQAHRRSGPCRLNPIWQSGEGHLITIAPTGAGKGVSCAIPALLSWTGSVVVIDPKGENYTVTARRRRELGQKVTLLDPFNVTGSDQRDALNPLDLLDPSGSTCADDANLIANLCVQGRRSERDPYWDDCAETLISGLVLYVAKSAEDERRNLGFVRSLLESSVGDEVRCAAVIRQLRDPEVDAASNILLMDSNRTRACIISNATSHLSFLRTGPVLDSLQRSTISLSDLRDGVPLSIYLVLPPDKLISHGKLLRLWLGVCMTVLTQRDRIPAQPTLFLIDEAAQLGALDPLRSALTVMRGYGVKVWSFWQDMSQLQRTYPFDWPTLLNNCAVQQFFGAATPFARKQLDDYLVGSTPKPVSSLTPDEMVLVSGGRPQIVRRPNYLNDTVFRGLSDPNPRHSSRAASSPSSRAGTNVLPFRSPALSA